MHAHQLQHWYQHAVRSEHELALAAETASVLLDAEVGNALYHYHGRWCYQRQHDPKRKAAGHAVVERLYSDHQSGEGPMMTAHWQILMSRGDQWLVANEKPIVDICCRFHSDRPSFRGVMKASLHSAWVQSSSICLLT